MIEEKYAFCWKCGHALEGEQKPGKLLSSAIDLDDEMTMQHEARPFSSSVLPWTTTKSPGTSVVESWIGFEAAVHRRIALVLVSLGLFGSSRSDTQTASAT